MTRNSRPIRTLLAWPLSLLAGAAFLAPVAAVAQTANREIIITITRVKALDKLDKFSKADFMARVSIAGDTITTKKIRQKDEIRPNWVLVKRVPAGRHDVKLAILDQDLTKAESIDINRVGGKRDLDFIVDTDSCKIEGFVTTYKCGTTIVRSGQDKKAAEIEFKVQVKKL